MRLLTSKMKKSKPEFFIINTNNFIMKKGIIKLMTLAAVSTAMVACTDDLTVNSGAGFSSDADLVGTLEDNRPNFTRMGMLEKGIAPYEDLDNAEWGLVWTLGDEVRVFTLDQLKYNYYKLKDESANQPKGEFDVKSAASKLEGDKKFAITDAQFVYGVSATSDGEARLTYTIPYRWTATSIDSDEDGKTDVRKFPAPYWGRAEEEGGTIKVSFSAMTAFLRVELDKLPAGTKKIVLTTHGNPYTIQDHDNTDAEYTAAADGFQLTDDPAILTAVNDKSETNYTWKDVPVNTTGANEPLSGTFNTLLKTGATLGVDEGIAETGLEDGTELFSRLVTRDEIIVDITATTPKVFYVPVIAQDYKNLHVIAAKAVSKYSYRYVGTELKTFSEPFLRGDYKFLTMSLLNLGDADALTVNAAIASSNDRADKTTVLNIDNLVTNDYSGYTDAQWNTLATTISNLVGKTFTGAQLKAMAHDRILIPNNSKGNFELNIAKITAAAGAAGGYSPVRNDLGLYGTNNVLYVTDDKTAAQATEGTNMVTINLPHQIGAAPETDADYELLVNLPTYNATIGSSVDGKNLNKLVAFVQGSLTRCVTGNNVLVGEKEIEDVKKSALVMETGVKDLNLLAGSKGDIYVYNTGAVDEYQPEISNALNIQTAYPVNIRVDNALVNKLNFVEKNPAAKDYVFSIGSTAFKEVAKVTVGTDKSVTATTENADVVMHSYWKNAALTPFADQTATVHAVNQYDQEKVYTTAQLASMGELTQADYYIDELYVNDMWLGAGENLWIGPEATVPNFHFDGRNVPLRKMSMQTIASATAGAAAVYVDDPHLCCTTCGFKPAVYTAAGTDATTYVRSFGLIRSYVNTSSSATIENVAIDDVYFADNAIDNVGAVVGIVEATGLTLQNNTLTDPKFDLEGKKIGGLAGYVKLTGDLTVTGNDVIESKQETDNQIVSEGEYVGGLIGKVEGAAITINDNLVELSGDIASGKEFVGGLAGDIAATGLVTMGLGGAGYDKVSVANIKAQDGSFAGGFAGNVVTTSAATPAIRVNFAEVTVPGEISSTVYYAGGLFGQVASAATGENRMNSAAVKVGTIAATEGFVGGEVGYAKAGTINFGRAEATQASDIEVGKIKGAYAMGGLLGSNSNNAPVNVITGKFGTEAAPQNADITINIKDWENTKAGQYPTYFGPSDAEAQRAGNISNVIGLLEGKPINFTIAKGFADEDLLDITDNLTSEKKIALGFKYHRDEYWNTHQDTDFWGDYNGYVGYGGATYIINGTPVIAHGGTTGYNLFKTEANYAAAKSKLQE